VYLRLSGESPFSPSKPAQITFIFPKICRFCWHHIKENLNKRCPACRRVYTDDAVEFKPIATQESVFLILNKPSYLILTFFFDLAINASLSKRNKEIARRKTWRRWVENNLQMSALSNETLFTSSGLVLALRRRRYMFCLSFSSMHK
jgi:RING/Ubox like zinc-binding domain